MKDLCGCAHMYHCLLHSPHTDTQCAVMMCADVPLTLELSPDITCTHPFRFSHNCLEDYCVKVAVQKLEKIDNSRLQDVSCDNVYECSILMYCVFLCGIQISVSVLV